MKLPTSVAKTKTMCFTSIYQDQYNDEPSK